jgi:hypothetical protein
MPGAGLDCIQTFEHGKGALVSTDQAADFETEITDATDEDESIQFELIAESTDLVDLAYGPICRVDGGESADF